MVWSPVLHTGLLVRDVLQVVVQFPVFDFIEDLGYDYFGFKTLEKSYLLKVNGILAYAIYARNYCVDHLLHPPL